MALADCYEEAPPNPMHKKCGIVGFADELPSDGERDALAALIANHDWPITAVERRVKREYPDLHVPGYSSFQRHRVGRCRCKYSPEQE